MWPRRLTTGLPRLDRFDRFGNIHLLRTTELDTSHAALGGMAGGVAQAAKQCIECYYAPGKGKDCSPSENGTLACCGESCVLSEQNPDIHQFFHSEWSGDCSCPTRAGASTTATDYYVQYTVKFTHDLAHITPVQTSLLVRRGHPALGLSCAACLLARQLGSVSRSLRRNSNTCGVQTTPDCKLSYNVLRDDTHPETLSSTSFSAPFDFNVVLAKGHQVRA